MKNQEPSALGQWLKKRCQKEGLSLRGASARTGLSHATIADIIKGDARASAETIQKLAEAFSEGGDHHRQALEDELLTFAGYRTERPNMELTKPMARLLDQLSQFSEPQLKIMSRFADFIAAMEAK